MEANVPWFCNRCRPINPPAGDGFCTRRSFCKIRPRCEKECLELWYLNRVCRLPAESCISSLPHGELQVCEQVPEVVVVVHGQAVQRILAVRSQVQICQLRVAVTWCDKAWWGLPTGTPQQTPQQGERRRGILDVDAQTSAEHVLSCTGRGAAQGDSPDPARRWTPVLPKHMDIPRGQSPPKPQGRSLGWATVPNSSMQGQAGCCPGGCFDTYNQTTLDNVGGPRLISRRC